MNNKTPKYRNKNWIKSKLPDLYRLATDSEMHEYYLEKIKESCTLSLQNKTYRQVYGVIELHVNCIAVAFLNKGAHEVLSGNQSGWKSLQQGLTIRAWAAKLHATYTMLDKQYKNRAVIFAELYPHALCQAAAMGYDSFAIPYAKLAIENFYLTKGGDEVWFYTMPFFPFVLKLFGKWLGVEIDLRSDIKNPLGGYQVIFDHWDYPELLAEDILSICDLHCKESVERGAYPAFLFAPYTVFPVEIMALYRIRKELGLETPVVDHQLLQNQLNFPPPIFEEIPENEIPDIQVAIERYKHDFPEPIVGW
ncbi:MAG: hypothetical protein R3B84_02790 [Zavarzinella sp.]